MGVAAAVLVLAALVMVVELGRFFGRKPEARGRRIPATRATAPRFVSFRFVGFDAGRPLVRPRVRVVLQTPVVVIVVWCSAKIQYDQTSSRLAVIHPS